MCSCYAPSRCSDFKTDRDLNSNNSNNDNNNRLQRECTRSGSDNRSYPDPIPLKGNLKKIRKTENHLNERESRNRDRRKVSWPDAHGREMAHVQEFEASASDDGQVEGASSSCGCVIQ